MIINREEEKMKKEKKERKKGKQLTALSCDFSPLKTYDFWPGRRKILISKEAKAERDAKTKLFFSLIGPF